MPPLDERLHVIYLALIGPAAALPALLLLERLERWALVRHGLGGRNRGR